MQDFLETRQLLEAHGLTVQNTGGNCEAFWLEVGPFEIIVTDGMGELPSIARDEAHGELRARGEVISSSEGSLRDVLVWVRETLGRARRLVDAYA